MRSDSNAETAAPDSAWRTLTLLNLYRLCVGIAFAAALIVPEHPPAALGHEPAAVLAVAMAYLAFAGIVVFGLVWRRPALQVQLTVQVLVDIAFVLALMQLSGGPRSGVGLLLVASLAATGLESRGRRVFGYAALASLGVLGLHAWQVLVAQASVGEFFHAGLLSLGFFATSGLVFTYARRIRASEALAAEQAIDLENLGQVNEFIIQGLPDGVIVIDAENRIRSINSRAEHLLDAPAFVDLQGRPPLDLPFPEVGRALANWRDNADSPATMGLESQQVRLSFSALGKNRRGGVAILVEDLSEAHAQARRTKLAALGRLTANIAHEIRNPLSAISHAAELLGEETPSDGVHARLIHIIGDNTARLDRLVADVLSLSRRDRAQPEIIAVNEFLVAFADHLCQVERIPRHCLAIEDPDSVSISFDRAHLSQILWNLVRNAWRHSSQSPGCVRIVAERSHQGSRIALDVIDDGPGVAMDLRQQLFEPFFTTDSQGTGLGLYIARELAAANDGTLEYVEVAPGGQFRLLARQAQA